MEEDSNSFDTAIVVAPHIKNAFQLPCRSAMTAAMGVEDKDAKRAVLKLDAVYQRTKVYMNERRIFDHATSSSWEHADDIPFEPVLSMSMYALAGLYANGHCMGRIYVMYDEAGNGKTFAGKALLRNLSTMESTAEEEDGEAVYLQGMMFTGSTIRGDYMKGMAEFLTGGEETQGWMRAFLDALDVPEGNQPSLLILDSFDCLGEDDVNLAFIQSLYEVLDSKKNIYVIVMTNQLDVADALCGMESGQRTFPMPMFYQGSDLAVPRWNGTRWRRELLLLAIRRTFPEKFPDDFHFDFVRDGMTILDSITLAKGWQRLHKVPGNSKFLLGNPEVDRWGFEKE